MSGVDNVASSICQAMPRGVLAEVGECRVVISAQDHLLDLEDVERVEDAVTIDVAELAPLRERGKKLLVLAGSEGAGAHAAAY